MFDIRELNEKADIKELYERITGLNLKKHSNQWEGVCPVCGGTDRFYILIDDVPMHWACRHCHPNRGTALDFIGLCYGLPVSGTGIKETINKLAECLGVSDTGIRRYIPSEQKKKKMFVPMMPDMPTEEWQDTVKPIVDRAQTYLWSNRNALSYLTSCRKLSPETIRKYKIGFNPNRFELNDIYFPNGYYFPVFIDKNIVRVKVRLEPRKPNEPKYKSVSKGIAVSLYCAKFTDNDKVIYVEGELDAITINQVAGDICKAVTFGSNSYIGVAEKWQYYYRMPDKTVICFDNDSNAETMQSVRMNEQKLQQEIIKAQSLDDANIRADAPIIRHLPEKYHDWNDILQTEGGADEIRRILTGFFYGNSSQN